MGDRPRIVDHGDQGIYVDDWYTEIGWLPGDPCASCDSRDTFINDDGVAECRSCHRTDADES